MFFQMQMTTLHTAHVNYLLPLKRFFNNKPAPRPIQYGNTFENNLQYHLLPNIVYGFLCYDAAFTSCYAALFRG